MFKKILIMFIVGALALGSVPTYAEVKEISNGMDELDLIIAAGSYLNSSMQGEQCISRETYIDIIVPLYSSVGDVVAYYVTFLPSGYAVVNNNVNNPTVIEFGVGCNHMIDEILNESESPHIVYNNPFDVYDTNTYGSRKTRVSENNIYTYYPDLLQDNYELSSVHNEIKRTIIECQNKVRGDGDYGFVNVADMPAGVYTSDTIWYAISTDWAVMDEFTDIANNHCGATAVTNLALYFAKRGNSNLKINNHTDTFKAVHNIVGNGPVFTIANSAKEYFEDRGYTLNYSGIGSFDEIKLAIKNNHPCGILLADSIISWHWIICVGYREYSNSNEQYMRIMDGWYNNVDRYYKINTGSMWLAGSEYWM